MRINVFFNLFFFLSFFKSSRLKIFLYSSFRRRVGNLSTLLLF